MLKNMHLFSFINKITIIILINLNNILLNTRFFNKRKYIKIFYILKTNVKKEFFCITFSILLHKYLYLREIEFYSFMRFLELKILIFKLLSINKEESWSLESKSIIKGWIKYYRKAYL